jgi:hypothetical protein
VPATRASRHATAKTADARIMSGLLKQEVLEATCVDTLEADLKLGINKPEDL